VKLRKRALSAVVAAAFASSAPMASDAQMFSNVVVFGDSLSDVGYFRPFLASIGLPASVVATLGRFTTNPGPIWAELVAQHYGTTATASNAGGFVYAQGGARVALPSASTPPGGAQRPVSAQVTEYLARTGGAADPNALYTVWAGANDIFQNLGALSAGAITAAQLQTNVLAAANAEVAQVARLKAAGARYIAVFALPDIGATPQFGGSASTAGQVTLLSAGYNTTLFTGLAASGLRVIPVDAFSLLSEIRANPTAYGFSNITNMACGPFPPITTTPSSQFCLPANYVTPNAAETYLFADGVHPTTASHRIVAQFLEGLIDGPAQMSLLAEVPLRTRAGHLRTLNDGLAQGSNAPVGQWTVFASGEGGGFDIENTPDTAGIRSASHAVTLGTTVRVSEAVTLGLAAGQAGNSGSFGSEAGGYKTRDRNLSLFGSAHWGGLYTDFAFTIANIEYEDLRRAIQLGPVKRQAVGSTNGSNSSAYVAAGYDFRVQRLTIGPTVSVTSQNVDVNGFDESGAGSANLRYGSQKRRSEVWSVGARASYDLGAWTPWARITADKERRDDERFVTATPLSLVSIGSSYDIPAYAPDTSFVTTMLGVRGMVTQNVGVSLAYAKVSGRSGISDDSISGMVSIRF
jgi:outer membrane lipase/esterase